MTSFGGLRCVVTGASSGIGYAIAYALAEREAHVYAIGRNHARLKRLVGEVAGREGRVVPIQADFERDADVDEVARQIVIDEGRVDILVHSAGAIELGTIEAATLEDFDRLYRVNLRAPVALTQALLPGLREARGQVVFINSSAAVKASATNVLYAVTKAGLKTFADGFRDCVNPHNVRVITVFAGRTATPMQKAVHEFEGREYRPEELLQPGDVVNVVLEALALPATAEMTEVSVRPVRKSTEP